MSIILIIVFLNAKNTESRIRNQIFLQIFFYLLQKSWKYVETESRFQDSRIQIQDHINLESRLNIFKMSTLLIKIKLTLMKTFELSLQKSANQIINLRDILADCSLPVGCNDLLASRDKNLS